MEAAPMLIAVTLRDRAYHLERDTYPETPNIRLRLHIPDSEEEPAELTRSVGHTLPPGSALIPLHEDHLLDDLIRLDLLTDTGIRYPGAPCSALVMLGPALSGS